MVITGMTSVALDLVFRLAISSNIKTLDDWKQCLALLAVNREWREITKLWLYSSAIASFVSKQRITNNGYYSERRVVGYYSEEHSNIELIVANGGAHLVTNLKVVSNYTESWKKMVDRIYDFLLRTDMQWTNICKLRIDCTNVREASALMPENTTVTAIINALPNINDITFRHPHKDKDAVNMCSRFINYYKNQLTNINSNIPLSFLESHFISKLTFIDLTLSSTATHQLPYVCANSLRVLRLYNVPHDFSWRYFQKDMTSDELAFLNLEVLKLDFQDNAIVWYDSEWTGQPSDTCRIYQLQCPMLKSLVLKNCPPSFGLFQPFLSTSLTHVDFHGAISALALCGGLCFGLATELSVTICKGSAFDDAAEFCRATGWIFNNTGVALLPYKPLNGFKSVLEPNLTMWGSLTNLGLNQTVMFKSILKLLHRLPSLITLAIHALKLDNTNLGLANQSHYQEMQHIIAMPLDTKLETLLIKFIDGDENGVARVIQTLLIQLKTLRRLQVQAEYISVAHRFKDSAPYQYPHIMDVSIEECV
ncbi:hypothetical protein COEREDRAFT_8317 [Coemansia reversa NRRL 1564]|uniref:F-box domain-containing protein n=1 Tax=Coemansia reversa (strain ATCC 12441 / NRRL 1564) TaxID=763665 RepID=A0A2G5BCT5_COERN|nr:hypothetical protein COEREDRAFT_8317 [Coemansia reversa NRRL 1564]|eukprot:PIA16527.1 hypothetical protein COEREDRAFT_8317 [Coemansia reversa NRRL 1564]